MTAMVIGGATVAGKGSPKHGVGAAWLLCVLMVAAQIAAESLKPTRKLGLGAVQIDIATAIPQAFGRWQADPSMTPIAPTPDQQVSLDSTYDQIISRTYVNAERQQVMLSVAYGSSQRQGLRAHRQEICYRAQGFHIGPLEKSDLDILGRHVLATRFVARYGNRSEPVTYWFTMGDHVVRSYMERQVVQLQYALSGYIPDGYLFRVSSFGANPDSAYALQQSFIEELLRHVPHPLRQRLIGGEAPSQQPLLPL